MKLLYITNACPWPAVSGMAQRDGYFIRHLAASHEVRVVVLDAPPPPPVAEMPVAVEFRPFKRTYVGTVGSNWLGRWHAVCQAVHPQPEIVREHSGTDIYELLCSAAAERKRFDRLWVSRSYFARYAIRAGLADRTVVDFPDVESAAQRSHLARIPPGPYRLLARLDTVKLAAFERRIARRSWRCVVCKEEDRELLGSAGKNVHVVPNGTKVWPPCDPDRAEAGRMLFVGLLSYAPNADAVHWFARDVLPRLPTSAATGRPVLDVVGRDAPASVQALRGPQVLVRGFVPDLEPMYSRAAVVVAPIHSGSGTRLKVLEALSRGKALVATTEAVRGIAVRDGIDCLLADTAEAFAAACGRLLSDSRLRAALGRSGRERVIKHYSWDRVGSYLDRVFEP